jgi:hypothetical protein
MWALLCLLAVYRYLATTRLRHKQENSLLLVNKFPAQFMQGISRQVIEAANLPGVAGRGGGQIQEDSLLNSLLAGNWFRWE